LKLTGASIRTAICLTVTLLVPFLSVRAQGLADTAIEKRLEWIKSGRADLVKAELPSLLTRYQNEPGVLYLQGVLTSDGTEAVKIFQSVVDNFPESAWADDALYKIYQYYYSLGLYKSAEQKYQQLKNGYPNSPYVRDVPTPGASGAREETAKVRGGTASNEVTYAVQVGAFSTAENAHKQKKYLQGIKHPVEILNRVRGGKSYYLVWVGIFKTREAAQEFSNEIRAQYKIDPIVVER